MISFHTNFGFSLRTLFALDELLAEWHTPKQTHYLNSANNNLSRKLPIEPLRKRLSPCRNMLSLALDTRFSLNKTSLIKNNVFDVLKNKN